MAEPRSLRADARRNRDAILTAARDIFDRDEQVRFDDFAARAGVGVGTLYRHFPTREALTAAVYEGEVAALCENASDPNRSAVDNLDVFLRSFAEYVVANAGLARTMAAVVDPAVHVEGGLRLERTVSDLVHRAVDEGSVRADISVGGIMIVLHGIGSASDRPLWAAESRAAVDLMVRGLRAT